MALHETLCKRSAKPCRNLTLSYRIVMRFTVFNRIRVKPHKQNVSWGGKFRVELTESSHGKHLHGHLWYWSCRSIEMVVSKSVRSWSTRAWFAINLWHEVSQRVCHTGSSPVTLKVNRNRPELSLASLSELLLSFTSGTMISFCLIDKIVTIFQTWTAIPIIIKTKEKTIT